MRAISNKRPWYNFVNKGSLISRKGMYLNWWQTGLCLVVIFGGLVWIGSIGIGGMERISNRSMELMESLQGDFEQLEKKNEALIKELDECKGTRTETSDDKTMTP